MSIVRFISDLHFGHDKIAQIRGFKDSTEQDEYIISEWNKNVHKRDLIYILGDISRNDISQYYKLGLLQGKKVLIAGNHDSGKNFIIEALKYFERIHGMLHYSSKEYGRIWLTHCPIHPLEFNEKHLKPTSYNVHGHIHAAYKIDDPRYINVSAEIVNYIPRSLKELIKP